MRTLTGVQLQDSHPMNSISIVSLHEHAPEQIFNTLVKHIGQNTKIDKKISDLIYSHRVKETKRWFSDGGVNLPF